MTPVPGPATLMVVDQPTGLLIIERVAGLGLVLLNLAQLAGTLALSSSELAGFNLAGGLIITATTLTDLMRRARAAAHARRARSRLGYVRQAHPRT